MHISSAFWEDVAIRIYLLLHMWNRHLSEDLPNRTREHLKFLMKEDFLHQITPADAITFSNDMPN